METQITPPPDPEFFSAIKLINNELIISGASLVEDEGMFVYDPIIVKTMSVLHDAVIVPQYHLSPWMIHSMDRVFYIDACNIVSQGELSKNMFDCYIDYINSESYISVYFDQEGEIYDEVDGADLTEYKKSLQKLFDEK